MAGRATETPVHFMFACATQLNISYMRLKVSWHGFLLLLFLCSEFFTHMPIYIYIYIYIYMYMYIYTHMYIYILRRISESRCSILIGAPLSSKSHQC